MHRRRCIIALASYGVRDKLCFADCAPLKLCDSEELRESDAFGGRWIFFFFFIKLERSGDPALVAGEKEKKGYTYHAVGHITSKTETTGIESFTKTYTYDALSRLHTENWHTGFGIKYQYNQVGARSPREAGLQRVPPMFLQMF